MGLPGQFFRKLGMFVRREKFNRELEEEMALHRDLAERELRASGMEQQQARHAANRQFGNSVRLKEQSIEIAGFRFERVLQDCRYALRQITKAPGFAFTVIPTMALGIAPIRGRPKMSPVPISSANKISAPTAQSGRVRNAP